MPEVSGWGEVSQAMKVEGKIILTEKYNIVHISQLVMFEQLKEGLNKVLIASYEEIHFTSL